ncbi:MAG: MFS transporter [Promethearchaeota archaeon]|jgi:GPH family glycoside/pentoside/hexuronide:cation symporter
MDKSLKMKFADGITTKKMIFFSFQGIISGFLFGMWGQIQYFAVNDLLIPQSILILVYLVYSIVDGINDPLIGYFTDRSKRFTSKYGKRFLWIMVGVGIGPILLIFSFIKISSSVAISVIWLIIIMAIYETFITSFEINHNALFPDMFREQFHRNKVSIIGVIIGGIITIFSGALIPVLIESAGYLITVIILIIIVYLLIIPYSKGIREPEEMRSFRAELDKTEKASSPAKEVVKRVFKDKNWMGIVIAGFCWAIAGACFIYGLNFFVEDNLGLDIGRTAIPLMMVYLISIILAPVWIWISNKIGIRKAYIIGMLFNIIAYSAFIFVTDLFGVILVFTFSGIGFSATYGVITNLLWAEGIDNATVSTGKREEGTYTGILKIFTAFSYFFQTVIFAIISGITGYDAILGTGNSNFAKNGLKFQMSIIPAIIILVGTIAFLFIYKISKEEASDLKVKLEEMNL